MAFDELWWFCQYFIKWPNDYLIIIHSKLPSNGFSIMLLYFHRVAFFHSFSYNQYQTRIQYIYGIHDVKSQVRLCSFLVNVRNHIKRQKSFNESRVITVFHLFFIFSIRKYSVIQYIMEVSNVLETLGKKGKKREKKRFNRHKYQIPSNARLEF